MWESGAGKSLLSSSLRGARYKNTRFVAPVQFLDARVILLLQTIEIKRTTISLAQPGALNIDDLLDLGRPDLQR